MEDLVQRERPSLNAADYVVFSLTVVISSCIGVFFAISGGRQKTTSEYLVGNRKMKVGPVGLSLIVSFESSILMLGWPAEMYAYGTQYVMGTFGFCLSCLIIMVAFVPLIHPLKLTSIFEYLELRYKSRKVRRFAALLGILYQTFYMGIVLFGPATALDAVTGFPAWGSIILVACASVFYTSVGGFKAVIWTDVFQCTIMVGGMVAVIVMGCLRIGGFLRMWELNEIGGRIEFLNFDTNPLVRNTFWALIFGNCLRSLQLGFNQTMVQKVVSMDTLNKARIIVFLTIPGFMFFSILACLEGTVAYGYFVETECDPYRAKIISNPNQVVPYIVMEIFRDLPGLPGLFLAALFSASLSALSSCLSSISAIVSSDFIKPHAKQITEGRATCFLKIVVIVFGCVTIGIAFLTMVIGGPLGQISSSFLGAISGPLAGIFIAGCSFPITNAIGAMTGGVISFTLSMWMSLGSSLSPYTKRTPYLPPAPIHNCFLNGTFNMSDFLTTTEMPVENLPTEEPPGISNFYSISFHYFGGIGLLSCIIVAVLTSILTGGCKNEVKLDEMLIVPLLRPLWKSRLYRAGHEDHELDSLKEPDVPSPEGEKQFS